MTRAPCATPIELAVLAAYWLGELPEAEEAAVEEHFLGCGECARRLEQIAAMAAGIRAVVRSGAVQAVITTSVLEHMKQQGMRIREYRVAPGGQVACTMRAEDDAVVSRLQAPLAGVTRVDVVQSLDLGDGHLRQWRLADVPFDPEGDEVISLPSARMLRDLPAHTFRFRLVAVDEGGERSLGDYTFAHTPG